MEVTKVLYIQKNLNQKYEVSDEVGKNVDTRRKADTRSADIEVTSIMQSTPENEIQGEHADDDELEDEDKEKAVKGR